MELKELFLDQLQQLASAEQLLIASLPEFITASANPQLSSVFENHLRQTEIQSSRIHQVFANLNVRPATLPCRPLGALIAEASRASVHGVRGTVRDFALIEIALRIEHFEIAAYRSILTLAESLNYPAAAKLLNHNLVEEQDTAQQLTLIHHTIVERSQELRTGT